MDRDDVTSASLAVVGVVASTVAKALVLGGRLMAAGLGRSRTPFAPAR